jgi:hypothetical protein
MSMDRTDILQHLCRLGELLDLPEPVEILLVGGAAGVLTRQLVPERTTTDCDVIRYKPDEAESPILETARQVANEFGLPVNWMNSQAMSLNILPDGWHTRKVLVGEFGLLAVFALSRRDLLATKFYAGHPRDLDDITAMAPAQEELEFVRTYLNMLRVPSREANLDQVTHALRLLDAFTEDDDS